MTVQYVMLVLLGFLIATLIAMLLAPAFWSRAVRLTTDRLRNSMPATESEILADKDQLRAKYAIRVHQLEKMSERASLAAARQKIELNRRDASISGLESEIGKLHADLEENQNARSVLEQTVADRIPKIEARLEEARKLLLVRDGEIAELSQTSRRQQEALHEARVIGHKQTGEMERLRTQLLAYDAQSRKGMRDGDFEGELAVRAELETLRSRVRDQSSLIDRLNAEVSAGRANSTGKATLANGHDKAGATDPALAAAIAQSNEQGVLIEQLRRQLAESEEALKAARAAAPAGEGGARLDTVTEQELRALRARAEDQAAEMTRLKTELAAAVAAGEGQSRGVPSLRDNRVAMKARLGGLEAKIVEQDKTINRLRSELAASNERAARQSSHFMDEMRRLGVAAHVTQSRGSRASEAAARSRNVAKRAQAVLDASRSGRNGSPDATRLSPPAADPPAPSEPTTSAELAPTGRVGSLIAVLKGDRKPGGSATPDLTEAASAEADAKGEDGAGKPGAKQRARLLDRIGASEGKS
jgi:uncharacterized coiled-coil protein SlyX